MDSTLYAKAISNLLGNNVGFSVESVDYSSLSINGDKDKPSETAITEEVARLQAEYDAQAYARARAEAYPNIGDQLDMMYHDQTEGSRTWLDAIEAVKEAYPK